MTCPGDDELIDLALGCEPTRHVQHHLDACSRCAAVLEVWRNLVGTLERAHVPPEGASLAIEAGRQRLLAALHAEPAPPGQVPHTAWTWREIFTMKRIALTLAACLACVALGLLFWNVQSAPALAQTTEALRNIKTYRVQMRTLKTEDGKEQLVESGRFHWDASGAVRLETLHESKVAQVRILRRGKAGINIDHRAETYSRIEPLHGPGSFLDTIGSLAKFAGKPDRELPARKLGDRNCPGFEIALNRLGAELGEGTLSVWIDPTTKLPVVIEVAALPRVRIVLEDFAWDLPTEGWFDTEAPARYKDVTPVPAQADPTDDVVFALKIYAKHCGKYPPGKAVYGDVASQALFKAAGLGDRSRPPTVEDFKNPAYPECQKATSGLGQINGLQRENPDSAYHGETVTPQDRDRVLFRWKLNDGTYRVLRGDLRSETQTAEKLKQLEGK